MGSGPVLSAEEQKLVSATFNRELDYKYVTNVVMSLIFELAEMGSQDKVLSRVVHSNQLEKISPDTAQNVLQRQR